MILLVSILLLRTATKGEDFGNVSLIVSVSQKTFEQITGVVLKDISNQLQGRRFSEVSGSSGDLSYRLHNITVSKISGLTSSVSLNGGSGSIDWSANINTISAISSFSARLKLGSLFLSPLTITTQGMISAKASNLHLGMSVSFGTSSGALYIATKSCSSEIGGIDVRVDVGNTDFVSSFQLVTDFISDELKTKLNEEMCKAADDVIVKAIQDLKNINTITTIHIFGVPLTLDLGLVSTQIRNNRFNTYHQGIIKYENTTYETSAASSVYPTISGSMLSLYMRKELLDNFVKALSDHRLLDCSFSDEHVDPKYKPFLAFDCPDGYCIGMFIPKLNQFYASSNLKMRTRSIVAALNVQPNSLIVQISGRLELLAARPNFTDAVICSGAIDLEVPLQVLFQGTRFVLRVSNLWGNLTIESSNIGHILEEETSTMMSSFLSYGKDIVIDQLAKYNIYIPINLPKYVTVSHASVKLQSGILGLEADICYNEACSYTGTETWVGDSFVTRSDPISVFDVTPLDTTLATTKQHVVGGKGSGAYDIKTLSVHIALRAMMLIVFVYLLF